MEFTKKDVNDVLNFTDKIIKEEGGRLCGSKSCQNTARKIYKEFQKNIDARIEEFKTHPDAFLSFTTTIPLSYVLAIIFILINIVFSITLVTTALIFFIIEFIFYNNFFDFIFKKKSGNNVIGEILPKNKIKKHIILCSHHDSAHIFNFLQKHPKLYKLRVFQDSHILFCFLFLWYCFNYNIFLEQSSFKQILL